MQPMKRGQFILAAMLLCILIVPGCATKDGPIPPDGTRVTSTSEVFRRTASDLEQECERMGGCTCILDGIQTTCAVVFACLDAGFCERVASD